VALNLPRDTGVPLEKPCFTWHELGQRPYSQLDDNALMTGQGSDYRGYSREGAGTIVARCLYAGATCYLPICD
jgi:hypothetical protein